MKLKHWLEWCLKYKVAGNSFQHLFNSLTFVYFNISIELKNKLGDAQFLVANRDKHTVYM